METARQMFRLVTNMIVNDLQEEEEEEQEQEQEQEEEDELKFEKRLPSGSKRGTSII